MAATDKSEHWLNVVFRETPYILPGVEGVILPSGTTAEQPLAAPELQNGLIRYNTDNNLLEAYVGGTWENIVSGNIPLIHVVATEGNLAGIPAPSDGELATVMDNFSTGEEALYVWNTANTDLGLPLNKWRLLATSGLIPKVNHRNVRITASSTTVNIGDPVLSAVSPMIKEINVEIIQAFVAGSTLTVLGDSGGIIMASGTEINPELVGTYTKTIPGVNLTDAIFDDYVLDASGQITVQFNALASGGIAQVYIKYVIPN